MKLEHDSGNILLVVPVLCILVLSSIGILSTLETIGDSGIPQTSSTSDTRSEQTDWEPAFSILESPEEYGTLLSLAIDSADVNGDGIDDIITHNETLWEGFKGRDRGPHNIIILGRYDRDLTNTTFIVIQDVSHTFGIGDINGDGYDEIASYPYPTWCEHHYYPDVSNPKELQIRFGGPEGPSSSPDQVIDLKHNIETSGDEVVFGMCADVGDVNGDGFDDLLAIFRRAESYIGNYLTNEARIQLFYGSSSGLSKSPSMDKRMHSEFIDNVSYPSKIDHGDFNSDGFSDVVIDCWSYSNAEQYIEVRYGSRNGIGVDPDAVYEFGMGFYNGFEIINFDGDGYDDLAVGSSRRSYDHVRTTSYSVFKGSSDALGTRPERVFEFIRDGSGTGNVTWVKFTDTNADGMDEIVLLHVISQGTSYKIDLGYQIYKWSMDIEYVLNEGGAYQSSRSVYSSDFGWDRYYPRIVGDFEGDGADDIIVLRASYPDPPEEPEDPMDDRLLIIHGDGCRYSGGPVRFDDSKRLFAGLKAYDFRVMVDPTRHTYYDHIRLTLDPGNADVTFTWSYGPSAGASFFPRTHEYATIRSEAEVQRNSTSGNCFVLFSVMFDWDWPHEDTCNVTNENLKNDVVRYTYTSSDIFSVENDLDLVGQLHVSGELQGPLVPGDWVRGGEPLSFTGPQVVYQGTTDVHPPAGVCEIIVYDFDKDFVKRPNPANGSVDITFQVVDRTELYRYHRLTIQGLPGTAKGPSPIEFVVNVDADAPKLQNPMPDGDEWISSNEVLLGITADDGDRSGVDASTFEFSFRGTMGYGTWTRTQVEAGPDGPVVDATAFVNLPDGEDYHLRWRVSDMVGNRAVLPYEIQLRIDTQNVTFTDPVPEEDVWNNATELLVGITVRDVRGSGIDVSSVEYRVSGNNVSEYGPWTRYTGQYTSAREIEVRAFVEISDGPFNYIQWRAADIAGNGPTVSRHFRVMVDTTPMTFGEFQPKGVQRAEEVEATVEVTDGMGSGVNYDSIEYRYRSGDGSYTAWEPARIDTHLTGMIIDGAHATVMVYTVVAIVDGLVEGRENYVQFRGLDIVGNGPAISKEYRLIVDSSGPQLTLVSPEEGAIHPEGDVTFTVKVADHISGVDIERVQYRFGTDGDASFGDWMRIPVSPIDDHYIGSISVRFEPGRDNRIQFQCFDNLGNIALSKVYEVWVNQPPSALIVWPANGSEHIGPFEAELSGRGSSDPDGDPLSYLWFIDGEELPIEHDPELRARLDPGVHEITLIVKDPNGGWGDHTITITVEEGATGVSTGMILAIVIVIAAVVVIVTVYLRRRLRDESALTYNEIERDP